MVFTEKRVLARFDGQLGVAFLSLPGGIAVPVRQTCNADGCAVRVKRVAAAVPKRQSGSKMASAGMMQCCALLQALPKVNDFGAVSLWALKVEIQRHAVGDQRVAVPPGAIIHGVDPACLSCGGH